MLFSFCVWNMDELLSPIFHHFTILFSVCFARISEHKYFHLKGYRVGVGGEYNSFILLSFISTFMLPSGEMKVSNLPLTLFISPLQRHIYFCLISQMECQQLRVHHYLFLGMKQPATDKQSRIKHHVHILIHHRLPRRWNQFDSEAIVQHNGENGKIYIIHQPLNIIHFY